MSVLAVYMLSNSNILLQEGVSHDAVLYDQQFKELKRQPGKSMHEAWLAYEPNITSQRRTYMVVPDKYVTWFDSTESSAILDTDTLAAFPMTDLWTSDGVSIPAMVVTCSPDLTRFAGIGEYNNVQTFHVRSNNHLGHPTTSVRRVDTLCKESTIR